jgi:hypothetical protein
MQVQLYMHVLKVPSEKDQPPDGARWRIAPFRLRYPGDKKAGGSKRGSQGSARVCLFMIILLVIRLLSSDHTSGAHRLQSTSVHSIKTSQTISEIS